METKPHIFDYLDYRLYLKALLGFKKAENLSFSYRAFSRLAVLKSSNFLKLVIDGKRNLTLQTIHRFAKAFGMSKADADFFENLVLFNQAQSVEEKNRFYERIARSKSYHDA